MNLHINNVGDPFHPPVVPPVPNTFKEERYVINRVAKLWGAQEDNIWGYIGSSGSEGNFSGVRYGRDTLFNKFNLARKSDITMMYSDAAHFSLHRAADLLNIKRTLVNTDSVYQMDLADLERKLTENLEYYREHGLILVLTIGTVMTGSYDDVKGANKILKRLNIEKSYVHLDGALGGLILPFLDNFDLKLGQDCDSISISGHKICGLPTSASIFITSQENWNLLVEYTPYLSKKDGTLFGSRNGLVILHLYKAMFEMKLIGQKVHEMIDLTERIHSALKSNGVPALKVENGLAVYLEFNTEWLLPIKKKFKLLDNTKYIHFFVMEHHLNHPEICDNFVTSVTSAFSAYKNEKFLKRRKNHLPQFLPTEDVGLELFN